MIVDEVVVVVRVEVGAAGKEVKACAAMCGREDISKRREDQ